MKKTIFRHLCVNVPLVLLMLPTLSLVGAQKKVKSMGFEPPVNDLGECGGVMVRAVVYDQKALFSQKEDGAYNCFQLQAQIDGLNQEFERKKLDLRDRSRSLKTNEIDQTDPSQMAMAMKEQSALEIDAKLLQQEFQMRMNQLQGEFLQSVQEVIRELAAEFEWGLVLPIDSDMAFAIEKIDVTKKIVARLNDKFRAKQRAKKFADPAKKETTPKAATKS
jgi:Skp family chaperone for outer membrane proteins